MFDYQVKPFIGVVENVSHQRHLSFMRRMVSRGEEYLITGLGDKCPAILKATFQTFKQCTNREDLAFKKQAGSDYTSQIKEADEARDYTLSGLHALCEGLEKLGTDEQRPAAALILKNIALYKVSIRDSYEDEGIKLQQLCDDSVKIYDFADAVTKCGLTSHFAKLKEQNDACCELINKRNKERAEIDPQAMNHCRAETDAAYKDLMKALNAAAIYEYDDGWSPYNECITVINADIDYFKNWVLRKSKSGAEPDVDPDDEGDDDGKDDGGQDEGGDDGGKDDGGDE